VRQVFTYGYRQVFYLHELQTGGLWSLFLIVAAHSHYGNALSPIHTADADADATQL